MKSDSKNNFEARFFMRVSLLILGRDKKMVSFRSLGQGKASVDSDPHKSRPD